MKRYLLRRLALTLPVLIGTATLVFLLLRLLPTEVVIDRILGEQAPESQRAALRHELGLDRPLGAQYATYLRGLAQGDLGTSLEKGRPVTGLIRERLRATFLLAAAAALFALVVSLPLGLVAARTAGRWPDRLATLGAVLGASLPSFWLGPLLILVFAVQLDWLPVSGMSASGSLILPAVTLGAGLAAHLARMVRGSLVEAMGHDYGRTARAKGLGETRALLRHLLPNALIPVVTVLALQLGMLLTGAIITETVFAWPGLGVLLLHAIDFRDYPLVQGCVLTIALTYLLVNLLADLSYALLDPRIRLS